MSENTTSNEIITEPGTSEHATGTGGHVHAATIKPIDGGKDQPSWELLSTCVHCGLCLNHCPTYKTLGMEMDSPRGRIYQVLQVNEGKMELSDTFVNHIDRCL